MKSIIKVSILSTILIIGIAGCKKDKKEEPQPSEPLKNEVPEFFKEAKESDWGINQPEIVKLSTSQSRINRPTDLEFNPTRKGELWIINEGTSKRYIKGISVNAPYSSNWVPTEGSHWRRHGLASLARYVGLGELPRWV